MIKSIPIKSIVPSPFQKRADFSGIETLAEDIRTHGLLQAIIVRAHPQRKDAYQLIAGERRLRAFQLLNKKDTSQADLITADIKESCTDAQAEAIHISENLNREDITTLEEGEAVNSLLEHASLNEAAQLLGRSVQWVAGRASLCDLSDKWKKRYREQDFVHLWPVECLQMVARMPKNIQEGELLRYAQNIPTIKQLKDRLKQDMLQLKSAPWANDDMKCMHCQKRTASSPNLFSEINVEKDDRCLDGECWKKMMVQYLETKAAELRKENPGMPVVSTSRGETPRVLDYNHPLHQQQVEPYYYKKVKEGTKGAKQALVVEGVDIGKVIHIKIEKERTDGNGQIEKPKGPKSMKEKRAQLESRRVAKYGSLCIAELEKMLKKDMHFTFEVTVPILLTCGMQTDKDGAFLMDKYAFKGARAKPYAAKEAQKELTRRAIARVIYLTGYGIKYRYLSKDDIAHWGEALGLSCDQIYKDAVAAIPEPKSWSLPKK